MKQETRKIITRLKALEKVWDRNNHLQLFGWSGSLLLIDTYTNEIIERFKICADGGDPEEEEREDGKEYLVR